jgi:hypothetical protein
LTTYIPDPYPLVLPLEKREPPNTGSNYTMIATESENLRESS